MAEIALRARDASIVSSSVRRRVGRTGGQRIRADLFARRSPFAPPRLKLRCGARDPAAQRLGPSVAPHHVGGGLEALIVAAA
jgi:hypothetical protein